MVIRTYMCMGVYWYLLLKVTHNFRKLLGVVKNASKLNEKGKLLALLHTATLVHRQHTTEDSELSSNEKYHQSSVS